MAEALAKIKDNAIFPATTGDTDGSLLTNLIEALTAGAQLNVGQKGRVTHTAVNYTAATQIVDDHLAGIDTAFGGKASTTHKPTHVSAGSDAFASTDLLEAIVKRLQVTGPVTLTVGAVVDGKFLKRSGSTIIGDDPPGMSAHALGGSYHSIDTLANLNAKITGGSLDFNTAQRTAVIHNLGSNLRHAADTLANVNALITGGDLDFDSASRPPNGSASGDLSGTYPGPTVAKIAGHTVQTGAPSTGDLLQYSGAQWAHVASLSKIVVNQTAAADSVDIQDGGASVLKIYDGGIVDLPKQSGCYAYRNAAWNIPNNSWTKLPFDAESYDIQSEFDISAGNHDFTTTKAGIYLITAAVRIPGAGTSARIAIFNNGAVNAETGGTIAAGIHVAQITAILQLAAGRVIDIRVFQNSGVVKAITVGYPYTRLHIMKLA